MKLADKLADIILAEQELYRQLYNKHKELERHARNLEVAVEQGRSRCRDLEEMVKASECEVKRLDDLLAVAI